MKDQSPEGSERPQDSAPRERATVGLNIQINERDFTPTPPVYVALAHAGFDGFNIHLTFFTNGPTPSNDDSDENQVGVAARLVMPPPTAEALANSINDLLRNPVASGILSGIAKELNYFGQSTPEHEPSEQLEDKEKH